MRQLFLRRHESERRLVALANGGAPAGAPEEAPRQEQQQPEKLSLDAALDRVKQQMNNAEALKTVDDLQKIAKTDQEKANADLEKTLEKAASREFDHAISGGKTPEQALVEVQQDFGVFANIITFGLEDGKLVAKPAAERKKERPEPTTHEERISQEIEDAMDVFNDKDASIGKKLAAIFKMFALAKEFMKRAMDGTLGDAYESPKSKEQREKADIRNSIRAELNGGKTLEQLKTDKTNELKGKDQEIAAKKQQLSTQEASLPGLEQQLTAVTGTDQAAIDKRTALNTQIKQIKDSIAQIKNDIKKLEDDKRIIEKYIKEIDTMSNELAQVPDQIKNTLEQLGNALSNMPDDASKELAAALKGAKVEPTGGMRYKVTDAAGAPFNERIKTVMKEKLEKDVTDGEMGMDAGGNVIDNERFANFIGGIEKDIFDKSKELQQEVRDDITKKITEFPAAEQKAIKEAIVNLDTPAWVKIEGVDQELVFTQGVLYKQGTKAGEGLQKLDLSGDKAAWVNVPGDKYVGGPSYELKDIPEPGTEQANIDKRNRLYVYENREWRARTPKEILDGLADKSNLGEKTNKALAAPNSWVLDDADYDYFFDGKNVYRQLKNGIGVGVLNLDTFSKENGRSSYDWVEGGGEKKYFNGTQVKDVPVEGDANKLRWGFKYENHEWISKSAKESLDIIEYSDADMEAATNAALAAPNTWCSSNNVDAYFNGEQLYTQATNGTDAKVFDLEKFRADADGSGTFDKPLNGKYVNGSGAVVDLPSNKTHVYDPEAREWKFDVYHAIANLAGANPDQIEGLKAHAAVEGWSDNVKFPNHEGIKVGDMMYVQLKDNPGRVYIADLQKGTYTKILGKYYDGSTNTVVKVPPIKNRTEYDQEKRSWGKVEGSEATNRKTNRITVGSEILDNLGGGYEGVSTGSKKAPKYTIKNKAAGADVVDVRFNTSNHQWEWSVAGAGMWADMNGVIPGAGADIDYANDVRKQLQEVNESQDVSAPAEE